ESGLYQPGVTVALELSRELGETVESLFGEDEEGTARRIDAAWAGRGRAAEVAPQSRVILARIGGKVVAVSQPAAHLALSPAAGLVERSGPGGAEVSTFRSASEIGSTLILAGCDPAATLLAEWLARHRSPVCAVPLPCSSSKALGALAKGHAHAAGLHLRDPKSGEYNLTSMRRMLGRRPSLLVNFARWELGLVTASGNPLSIGAFADLARPGLRVVNREPGSGARLVLDEGLKELGIPAERIEGYELQLPGHLEVAAAVASGRADVGVAIRVAADAYGLGFTPLREERYDLAILERESASEPVTALLEALNSQRFAREVSQLCAYDTDQMGKVIARVG
ncbi:MAG TPA: substrate-binding domain-containing protein, partial [Candidatus Binataceae bacterium]|nr:substrate-binding domain-containing protein [Candidatus Binataceae bacterium]